MTLIIQDKFDGAAGVIGAWPGNVVARTTNSGHVWYPGNNGKNLRIDGAGAVTGNYPHNSNWGDAWCATQMPQANYWVELDVEIPTNDLDSSFDIFYKIQEQPDAANGAMSTAYGIVSWLPVNGPYLEAVVIGGFGTLMGDGQLTGRGAETFGAHTLRVTVVGVAVSVYIDGSFVASRSITGPIPSNGWVGFGMRSRNSDESPTSFVKILEFRAGDFLADLIPKFWTAYVGTTETS